MSSSVWLRTQRAPDPECHPARDSWGGATRSSPPWPSASNFAMNSNKRSAAAHVVIAQVSAGDSQEVHLFAALPCLATPGPCLCARPRSVRLPGCVSCRVAFDKPSQTLRWQLHTIRRCRRPAGDPVAERFAPSRHNPNEHAATVSTDTVQCGTKLKFDVFIRVH